VSGADWVDGLFAALMVAVAIYAAGRVVAAGAWSRPTHLDVDVAHVLMGAAMAGMLESDLNPLPIGLWEVVFALLCAWFIWRCARFATERGVEGRDEDHVHHLSHYATHLVMAAAMLYMYLAGAPAGAGSGSGMAMGAARGTTADFVLLPLVFIVVLLCSAIWELDGIGRFAPARSEHGRPALASAGSGRGRAGGEGAGAPVSPGRGQAPVGGTEGDDRWLAPRLEAASHIAMCVTMSYMLVLML